MAKKNPTVRKYGFWRCDRCLGENSGKFNRCPRCAAPIPYPKPGQISVFYLRPNSPIVDEPSDDIKQLAGPDWICSHCTANNSDFLRFCESCGNVKDESDAARNKVYYGKGQKVPETYEETFVKQKTRSLAGKLSIILTPVFLLVLFVWLLIRCTRPDIIELQAKLDSKFWKSTVTIEKYKTVREGDWILPTGGREVAQSQKVHHYNHILDHYETKRVQKSRQVADGSESYTTTHDNGDGSFSEETHSRTKYRTEYYDESVQEPVYRDDPVYQTWYDYDIEKWAFERAYDTTGMKDNILWPKYSFDASIKEREGIRYTIYYFTFNSINAEHKFSTVYQGRDSLWKALAVGSTVNLVLKSDSTVDKVLPVK